MNSRPAPRVFRADFTRERPPITIASASKRKVIKSRSESPPEKPKWPAAAIIDRYQPFHGKHCCGSAFASAKAVAPGYKSIYHFAGGFPALEDAHYPVEEPETRSPWKIRRRPRNSRYGLRSGSSPGSGSTARPRKRSDLYPEDNDRQIFRNGGATLTNVHLRRRDARSRSNWR